MEIYVVNHCAWGRNLLCAILNFTGSIPVILNINKQLNPFTPSPRRSCWDVLERRCSSKNNYRARFNYDVFFFLFAFNSLLCRVCSLPACTYLGVLGFHLKMPLVTQFEPIQVTLQTDQVNSSFPSYEEDFNCHHYTWIIFWLKIQVRDIPCGTKGGVMINFEKIEVKHWDIALFLTLLI